MHFFHMKVRAHFLKSRMQEYECKIMSAKIRAPNHERKTRNSICWEISWKLYAGKFLGNHMMDIYNLETICWEILGNYVLENLGGCQQLF